MMWPFKKKEPESEIRSSGTGYTGQVMAARADYIGGIDGVAELTGTVQGCVSLWEGGLSLADVESTDLLTPFHLALSARALALRGEAVFVIRDDGLLPCSDWDLSTRLSKPTAYRLPRGHSGCGRRALYDCPCWRGAAPADRVGHGATLHRHGTVAARTSHGGLAAHAGNRPGGGLRKRTAWTSIVPFPESLETDMEDLARGFRGTRGRVLIRESVNVQAAGSPAPAQDWNASDVTPDLSKSMTRETWAAARSGIEMAFGVLPGLSNMATTGPMVREAQRHLAQWALMPIAAMIGQEASDKLGSTVTLDVMRPLQAFDAGGRARTVTALIKALAEAKEAGIDPAPALNLVDWKE